MCACTIGTLFWISILGCGEERREKLPDGLSILHIIFFEDYLCGIRNVDCMSHFAFTSKLASQNHAMIQLILFKNLEVRVFQMLYRSYALHCHFMVFRGNQLYLLVKSARFLL